MTTAKTVMETSVMTVGVDDSLSSVCRFFYGEEITGAPVVDEAGKAVGVISISDLLRTLQEENDALQGTPNFYHDIQPATQPEWLGEVEDFEDRLSNRTVSDVMTTELVSVSPDTPIPEVVEQVLSRRVHRVLVVDDSKQEGNLAGIISLFDLVALLR